MTITLSGTVILNQVDKIITFTLVAHAGIARPSQRLSQASPPLVNYSTSVKREQAGAQPVFLDSQLGLILM